MVARAAPFAFTPPMKVYLYEKCGTCRKAAKFLEARKIRHTAVPIVETPPSEAELSQMLEACGGNLRRLFNTSGLVYKAMGLKDRLPTLSRAEACELLRQNGKLVRRPFLISDKIRLVGFNEKEWVEAFE